MLALVVAASVVVRFAVQEPTDSTDSTDSTYSTAAVRALVERASVRNRRVPESLRSYRANVESELAIIARQADGVEQTFAVEQTMSAVHWQRDGAYEQHVVGYRSQSVGVTVSAVGLFRQAWTVPILYGNRIALFFGQPEPPVAGDQHQGRHARHRRAATTLAVHPFSDDRERVYRFSGGDTVVTLRPGGRDIPIVRVRVDPRPAHAVAPTVVFRGDIELDAERAQIVRMRGYFVTVGRRRSVRARVLASQVEAVAYVELENGEFEQRYWLPTYQRVEAQAAVPLLGDHRAVFRVVSRFRRVAVNPGDAPATPASDVTALGADRVAAEGDSTRLLRPFPAGDTLGVVPHRLTFAPADSVDAFQAWSRELGELSGEARADDFLDVAPDTWRATGPPLLRVRYHHAADLFHYNRVEGAYTGLGAEAKLRDAAPGVIMRAAAGWAWAEGTLRGRVTVERQSAGWQPSVRVARSLDITNDFREPFDSGSTLGALFSVDDYDYVDRRSAILGMTRVFGRRGDVRVRVEGGLGSDHYAPARRVQGPLLRSDSGFRFNRGLDPGRYGIASMKLELHPEVNAAFVRPGLGGLLQVDAATGDIAWQRIELRGVARRTWGLATYVVRADAGLLTGGRLPAQQLFELGEGQNLPGYGYKEFAGDRAAVLRGLVMYPLRIWRSPLRLGRWVLPGIAPMVSFGAQSGWAAASSDAARDAIRRLGAPRDASAEPGAEVLGMPVSRPTDGIVSSVDFRLRFFGGGLSIGAARAIDHRQSWRLVVGLAQLP